MGWPTRAARVSASPPGPHALRPAPFPGGPVAPPRRCTAGGITSDSGCVPHAAPPADVSPGLFARLARGVRGLTRAAVDAAPVDDELLRHRRRVCGNCASATRTRRLGTVPLSVLTPTSTCGVCRCHLMAKTRLADERCPRGHWGAAAP